MLTPPKWQTVWLKSQYSSRNISKKIMFSKPEDKLLDDLSKSCSSTSKDLALEALTCWRIWIENQQVEDWKLNETCYLAVRPLLTKKFHPLHRDGEISERKLGLLWLILHKTQALMHLEGPQHILEVFIQSCLSWLSCSDDVNSNIRNLILKLLRSLFLNNVELQHESETFPPLDNDIWKSNKLFCRLLTLFLEIFHNWTKINEKTDLLCIWNHFLDHCEQSFRLIPVGVWHKIFKVVERICSYDKELIKNKISLLHKCATSLKGVLSNSKFIDCSQVLTSPAEALLKIVIELSVNNKDENIPFEVFQYCLDICQVLSTRIIHTFGYESCIYMLCKIEDIESKPLLWGLWCGFANCFRELVTDVNRENYSTMELKFYRKLRSIAVNFDLDRMVLEERCLFLVQNQLCFLRIPTIYENFSVTNEERRENEITLAISTQNSGNISLIHGVDEGEDEFAGTFGFDVKNWDSKSCTCLLSNQMTDSLTEICISAKDFSKAENQHEELRVCRCCRIQKIKRTSNYRHREAEHNFGINSLECPNFRLLCDDVQNERLNRFEWTSRRGLLFAPKCLTILLEDLCSIARKSIDSSTENFIENVKKVQNKVKEGAIVTPIKLFLSFKGRRGVEFYTDAVTYLNDLNEIINDVDLLKNLNLLKEKNDKSVVWLSMFFFLINFTNNLFFEARDNSVCELRKLDLGDEMVLILALINFMRKVTHYKTRLNNFAFLDNMNKILPTRCDNPVIIWTNCVSAKTSKANESVLEHFSMQESCYRTSNDNLINIFKCFDEMECKMANETDLMISKSVKRREKKVRVLKEIGRCSRRLRFRRSSPVTLQTEVKIMENESVTVLQAPPDVFRTMTFSEWRTDTVLESREAIFKESRNGEVIDATPEKRKGRESNACKNNGTPRKRRRQSSENKTLITDVAEEVMQDENVNIENRNEKCSDHYVKKGDVNVTMSPRAVYLLRKRPLQRPSKFKGTKCLFADNVAKRKCLNKNFGCCIPSPTENDFNRDKSSESCEPKVLKSCEKDISPVCNYVMLNTDNNYYFGNYQKLVSSIEDTNVCSDIEVEKTEILSDVNVDVAMSKAKGSDLAFTNSDAEISDFVNNLIEEVEEKEVSEIICESDVNVFENANLTVKTKSAEEGVDDLTVCNTASTTIETNRGVKRGWKYVDEATGEKKPKIEVDDYNPETEEREEPCEEEQPATAPKLTQKPDVLVIQSRGSRMLALIPESPKLNRFHDSSPSSKHQTKKPPNVIKNSRASKMLALLPELQEIDVGVEVTSLKETITEKTISEDENTGRGISGCTAGIMHHLTPSRKGSGISAGSPKRSPLRQRRSIRFDDDRNETVTYFTDSPPCQTIKQGMRFRGRDK